MDYVVACAQVHEHGASDRGNPAVCDASWDRPFYAYYQIGGAEEPDEAETEPKEEGELRGHTEGSHSPFGFIWQIASATGWSVDYILNGVNYQTLIMMLSDAPRYVSGAEKKEESKNDTTEQAMEDEAAAIVGAFRSKLNE